MLKPLDLTLDGVTVTGNTVHAGYAPRNFSEVLGKKYLTGPPKGFAREMIRKGILKKDSVDMFYLIGNVGMFSFLQSPNSHNPIYSSHILA